MSATGRFVIDKVSVYSMRTRLVAALLLTLVAAFPRFYELGRLSLYADEDLTVLSARGVLRGEGPSLPSGMPYLRALPFTWANAVAAGALGEQEDSSYRVPAAVLGTATPAVLFLTGSVFVSPPAALVAGTMMALSEWHIGFSRYARMYSPFLLFFILTATFLWKWAREGGSGNLALALVLFAMTAWLHLLGISAVLFALIPLALSRSEKGPTLARVLAVSLGAATLGYLANEYVIGAPYRVWSLPPEFALEGAPGGVPGATATDALPIVGLMALGALAGIWLGWRVGVPSERDDDEGPLLRPAMMVAWAFMGAFVAGGHFFGAAMAAAALLLLIPEDPRALVRRGKVLWLLPILGAAIWFAYALHSQGIGDGLRRLASFPFPYPLLFWRQFPGLVLLFLGGVTWVVLAKRQAESHGLVCVILAVIVPMGALGLMREWGATRYLIQVYPYMLLAGAAFLVHCAHAFAGAVRLGNPRTAGTILSMVVVVSGITGAHGLGAAVRAATLEHGEPVNEYTYMFPFHPDHRSTGAYVRTRLAAGDVVIAEHPETQILYAGQVDYWLRRPGDARAFLYLDADETPRDEYVSSRLLPTKDSIVEAVRAAAGRVWLITSGETAMSREFYLSLEQRAWLDSVEVASLPRFVGEDGVSSVYCLNCGVAPGLAPGDRSPR